MFCSKQLPRLGEYDDSATITGYSCATAVRVIPSTYDCSVEKLELAQHLVAFLGLLDSEPSWLPVAPPKLAEILGAKIPVMIKAFLSGIESTLSLGK